NSSSRLLELRATIPKCFSYCQKPMLALGGGKTRSALRRGPKHYKNRNGRNERPADRIKASFVAWRENSEELLFHRHFIVGAFENFRQNTPAHLLRLLDSVEVQKRRRNVVHAGGQAHQPKVMLNAGPHGKERAG